MSSFQPQSVCPLCDLPPLVKGSQPRQVSNELLEYLASLCVTSLEHYVDQFPQEIGRIVQRGPPPGNYPVMAPPAFSIELVVESTDYRGEIIHITAYRVIFVLANLPPLTFLLPKLYVVPDYLRRDIAPYLTSELNALLCGRAPVDGLLNDCVCSSWL